MAVKLLALNAGRPLPPQKDFWHSFLLEAEGHNAAISLLGDLHLNMDAYFAGVLILCNVMM
jgi:hypothetical protein